MLVGPPLAPPNRMLPPLRTAVLRLLLSAAAAVTACAAPTSAQRPQASTPATLDRGDESGERLHLSQIFGPTGEEESRSKKSRLSVQVEEGTQHERIRLFSAPQLAAQQPETETQFRDGETRDPLVHCRCDDSGDGDKLLGLGLLDEADLGPSGKCQEVVKKSADFPAQKVGES